MTSLSYDKLIERLVELVLAQSNEESDASISSSDNEEEMNGNQQQQHRRTNRGPRQQQQIVEATPVFDELIEAVLKRSFMKHLKGQAREHCQMGHKLELPIGRDFMRDANEKKTW